MSDDTCVTWTKPPWARVRLTTNIWTGNRLIPRGTEADLCGIERYGFRVLVFDDGYNYTAHVSDLELVAPGGER